jgi:hypothetical protein
MCQLSLNSLASRFNKWNSCPHIEPECKIYQTWQKISNQCLGKNVHGNRINSVAMKVNNQFLFYFRICKEIILIKKLYYYVKSFFNIILHTDINFSLLTMTKRSMFQSLSSFFRTSCQNILILYVLLCITYSNFT